MPNASTGAQKTWPSFAKSLSTTPLPRSDACPTLKSCTYYCNSHFHRWDTPHSMLNKVREAVSADRRRFKDAEFNLDLSYVTPRIIGSYMLSRRMTPIHLIPPWSNASFCPFLTGSKAMAIPTEGLQAAYRNHIDDVDAFLRRDHGENFMIWNLSEFSYDAKFSDKVRTPIAALDELHSENRNADFCFDNP